MAVDYVDTYRYLMSALIQVFGTMIPLNVVAVTFLHQHFTSEKTRALTGVSNWIARHQHHAIDDRELNQRHDIITYAAEEIRLLAPDEIEKLISDTRQGIEGLVSCSHGAEKSALDREDRIRARDHHGARKRLEDQQRAFESFAQRYVVSIRQLDALPGVLLKTFTWMVALVVALSIGLFAAGTMDHRMYFLMGACAIVASATGLLQIARSLYRAVKDSIIT